MERRRRVVGRRCQRVAAHGLGAAWDAAHASLAAAVDALDPEWVNAAAHKWVDCAIRFVNAVPLDGTTNTGGVGPSEANAERIWGGGMCRLSVFGARLGAATQQPGMEARAAECMTRFCRAVHPRIFNAWSDAWEDGGEWGHLFCMGTPLIGAAEPTLRLLLTLLGSYQGWCYRHDEAWDALLGMVWKSWEHNGCNYINNPIVRDTTPRVLQRCLLFVAGLCAFKCVESPLHRRGSSTCAPGARLLRRTPGVRVRVRVRVGVGVGARARARARARVKARVKARVRARVRARDRARARVLRARRRVRRRTRPCAPPTRRDARRAWLGFRG